MPQTALKQKVRSREVRILQYFKCNQTLSWSRNTSLVCRHCFLESPVFGQIMDKADNVKLSAGAAERVPRDIVALPVHINSPSHLEIERYGAPASTSLFRFSPQSRFIGVLITNAHARKSRIARTISHLFTRAAVDIFDRTRISRRSSRKLRTLNVVKSAVKSARSGILKVTMKSRVLLPAS